VCSVEKTKISGHKIESYDIDLIVSKDIICSELIEAIGKGLKEKMLAGLSRDIDVDINSFMSSEIEPEIIFGEKQDDHKKSDKLEPEQIYALSKYIFDLCIPIYEAKTKDDEFEAEPVPLSLEPVSPAGIGMGFVNFRVLPIDKKMSISDASQVLLKKETHGNKTLSELGFVTSSTLIFDPTGSHRGAALFQDAEVIDAFKNEIPKYNISDTPINHIDNEPIRIIPPTEPPKKNRQNIIMAIVSPLLMMGAMLIAQSFNGNNSGGRSYAMYIVMAVATSFSMIINRFMQSSEHRKEIDEWRKHYERYISDLLEKILVRRNNDVRLLKELYPEKVPNKMDALTKERNLVKLALEVNGLIFSRGQANPDFLAIRLGTSSPGSHLVPSVFSVSGEKNEVVFTTALYKNLDNKRGAAFTISEHGEIKNYDGYLPGLPFAIAEKYAYLDNAPVLLRLKDCQALGVVMPGENPDFKPLLDNMIFELCFYHSPDDLQFVIFCENTDDWLTKQSFIQRYKHLPHFRELLEDRAFGEIGNKDKIKDLSAFAFNNNDANLILNRLLELIAERKSSGGDVKYPHVIMFFLDEYELKHHPIAQYLPDEDAQEVESNVGLSFVFFKKHKEKLPKYCGQMIDATKDTRDKKVRWRLFPHDRTIKSSEDQSASDALYTFVPDPLPPKEGNLDDASLYKSYHRAYKIMSALYYERIAQGADVPSKVELFDLESKIDYGKRNVTKTLSVPIGLKAAFAEGGSEDEEQAKIVRLDLHEKEDGPHMLVAGTTGSGKSETVLTFLISLCTHYAPKHINLLLVDMKGGGFIKRLKTETGMLPHIAGTVTDVDGDENGTSSAYMLGRFLRSMTAEVKRRKILFNLLEVDSIDKYIATYERGEKAFLKTQKEKTPEQIAKIQEAFKPENALPHLVVVVDEFTELMRFSAENDSIDFKSQINTLFRVGRSLGFHLILVSQNIQGAISDEIGVNAKSKLCLKVATREASVGMIGTDLAASPQMPGNGRAYLLVGTGSRFEYFQSGFSGASKDKEIAHQVRILQAEMSGKYSLFYDSYANKKDNPDTQLKFMVEEIVRYCKEKNLTAPKQVFLPPLPIRCYYDFDQKTVEYPEQKKKKEVKAS
jgi:S-DNA-T family DNA segregation ATPase FtsK/SpoIIIE